MELLRRAHEAFNRRDLDAFLGFMDPEVDFVTRDVRVEGDPHYSGHDGVRRWWGDLFDVFPDSGIEVLEVRDLDAHLVSDIHVRGRGAASQAPFEQTVWQATEWRNGRATWWQNFDSKAAALEAVALRV